MVLSKENIFKNKNIAFFEPYEDFTTNPTLLSLSDKFINSGAKVDLYSHITGFSLKLNPSITPYPFPYRFKLWDYGVKRTLQYFKRYLISFYRSRPILKRKRYDLILGVDSDGVIASWNFSKNHHVPFVYISFEISFRDELKRWYDKKDKNIEIIASQKADMVIIQDKWRAKLLAEENVLSINKFVYLPVAPKNSKVEKSQYLREKFNIPNDKKIVLHSGNFDSWTCAEELIESLPFWPENAVAVIHTPYRYQKKLNFVDIIKIKNFDNVILSTDPLDSAEYEEMVASADIGLVLYKQLADHKFLQKNIKTIGLSSGKFSYYVKHGLPVISFRQQSYSELLKVNQFGINLNSFSEIAAAINKISENYDLYTTQARCFFLEKLDFNIHWPSILDKLYNTLNSRK